MDEILKYLRKAEGVNIHRNSTEEDITAPYGIYKYRHPKAEIFNYIGKVADMVGIYKPTKDWSEDEIEMVNKAIDSRTARRLAVSFYEEYLKPAHLHLYPRECQQAVYSLYTNSPKYGLMAIQTAMINTQKEDVVQFHEKLSGADGGWGTKTEVALLFLNEERFFDKPINSLYFEKQMLLAMSNIYTELVYLNPEKYLEYSRGWDNRLLKLAQTR